MWLFTPGPPEGGTEYFSAYSSLNAFSPIFERWMIQHLYRMLSWKCLGYTSGSDVKKAKRSRFSGVLLGALSRIRLFLHQMISFFFYLRLSKPSRWLRVLVAWCSHYIQEYEDYWAHKMWPTPTGRCNCECIMSADSNDTFPRTRIAICTPH